MTNKLILALIMSQKQEDSNEIEIEIYEIEKFAKILNLDNDVSLPKKFIEKVNQGCSLSSMFEKVFF
jgi:hypothetical protein